MPSKRGLLLVSWCLGLISVSTQVMIIRELLVAFTGNELTIATSLAFWLARFGFDPQFDPWQPEITRIEDPA